MILSAIYLTREKILLSHSFGSASWRIAGKRVKLFSVRILPAIYGIMKVDMHHSVLNFIVQGLNCFFFACVFCFHCFRFIMEATARLICLAKEQTHGLNNGSAVARYCGVVYSSSRS